MSRFSPGFLTGGAGTIAGTLPSVRGQGTASTATSGTQATPANPASAVAGDLLIAMIATTSNRASSLATVSSGWTFGGVISQGNSTIGWAWGYSGVVAGNCQFTWTTTAGSVSRVTAFKDVRATGAIGLSGGNTGSTNNMQIFGWGPSTHGMSLNYIISANQGTGSDTSPVSGFTHVSQNTSTGVSLNQTRQNAAVDPKGTNAADYTSATNFGGLAWSVFNIEIMSIAVP